MKRISLVFVVVLTLLVTCSASFAQAFATVNYDLPSPGPNVAIVYQNNSGPGISVARTLTMPAGQYGIGGGAIVAPRVVMSQTPNCIWVSNAGTGTISAFVGGPGYTYTGSYSAGLSGTTSGIGMALGSNIIVAAYSTSQRLAVWKIGPSCALTLVSVYPEFDQIVNLAISSDGKTLVVAEPNHQRMDPYLITGTTLTATPSVSLTGPACTPSGGCFPAGIDITKLNTGTVTATVVVGNAVPLPYYVEMQITAPGTLSAAFTNNPVCTTCTLAYTESPEFSPDAWSAGGGQIYFGASGNPTGGGTGIATCPVLGYSVNCAAPALLPYTCTACRGGNIAVAVTSPSPNGIWQVVYQAGTNYLDLPKIVANVVSPYKQTTHTTGSPGYSVAALPGRPLN
jgi:hypothetical protein